MALSGITKLQDRAVISLKEAAGRLRHLRESVRLPQVTRAGARRRETVGPEPLCGLL